MSTTQAKKIVRRYAQALRQARYPYSAIYLFGSQKKGGATRWSDIDVAVVTNKLRGQKSKNRLRLWELRMNVDTRIEPHGFTPQEFNNDGNPMAHEIRTTGTLVE